VAIARYRLECMTVEASAGLEGIGAGSIDAERSATSRPASRLEGIAHVRELSGLGAPDFRCPDPESTPGPDEDEDPHAQQRER
jgi:hypothetical protein